MDASVTNTAKGADNRAEAQVASYERAGYVRVAPAMLQPAEPFLDLSGEDIRNRMYLTTAPGGGEFCLRPDLTIPVSRDYLASPIAGQPAGFCYLGPVFRHREDQPAEFLQAGIESFGRADKAAADAEMLSLGLDATAGYGLASPDIKTGDVALFCALVAGLDLPPAWKRRGSFRRIPRLGRPSSPKARTPTEPSARASLKPGTPAARPRRSYEWA